MKNLRTSKTAVFATTLITITSFNLPALAENSSIKSYVFESSYEDAKFDLGEALTNKGLVVNNKAEVVNMLNRTAKDVGATKTIYKNGEVVEFCSANLSRAAMEADPLNMAYCPYTMFIYETTANPGKITVGYKILNGASDKASKKALDAVNKLLNEMVRETAGLE